MCKQVWGSAYFSIFYEIYSMVSRQVGKSNSSPPSQIECDTRRLAKIRLWSDPKCSLLNKENSQQYFMLCVTELYQSRQGRILFCLADQIKQQIQPENNTLKSITAIPFCSSTQHNSLPIASGKFTIRKLRFLTLNTARPVIKKQAYFMWNHFTYTKAWSVGLSSPSSTQLST